MLALPSPRYCHLQCARMNREAPKCSGWVMVILMVRKKEMQCMLLIINKIIVRKLKDYLNTCDVFLFAFLAGHL